jgi:hypothetical protein
MTRLVKWTVRRSGAAMTIEGENMAGEKVRAANIVKIQQDRPWPFATAKNGETYELAA